MVTKGKVGREQRHEKTTGDDTELLDNMTCRNICIVNDYTRETGRSSAGYRRGVS